MRKLVESIVKLVEANSTNVSITIPLFIRLLEWSREECKDDAEIHVLAEKIVKIGGVVDMDSYDLIIAK